MNDPIPSPSPATLAALSSQGWKQRDLPGFAARFGPLWTCRGGDGWRYAILPGAEHLNPSGVVHGGAIAALLDHVLSTIAWQAHGRRPCVTVQLDTQFLHAARPGELLEARGTVLRSAGSLVFMRGEVVQGERLVASAAAVLKQVGERP